MYTAIFGAFSSTTASMFSSAMVARIFASSAPEMGWLVTPRMFASRMVAASSGSRNEPPR